jgi:ribosomal protein L19
MEGDRNIFSVDRSGGPFHFLQGEVIQGMTVEIEFRLQSHLQDHFEIFHQHGKREVYLYSF